MKDRLKNQINFILEIDKLKNIYRQSLLLDGKRRENDAEHSWHIAIMALVLQEYSNFDVDILKVIKMLILHDIVEIDAGDVVIFDTQKRKEQANVEKDAANRIFGKLPIDQRKEFINLWNEFEELKTPESKYARVLDRLEPILLNYYSGGRAWKDANITKQQVIEINQIIEQGATEMWEFVQELIDEATNKGYLKGHF